MVVTKTTKENSYQRTLNNHCDDYYFIDLGLNPDISNSTRRKLKALMNEFPKRIEVAFT